MRCLFIMDQKDYDESWKRFTRPSVRGIIIINGYVAMVYSCKFDYYKFPGGGIENDETHPDTLKRELYEEIGAVVCEDSITEYGSALRLQKSLYVPETVFEQENFYYLCNADFSCGQQHLDAYEAEEGFRLEFVTPEHAIEVNRTHCHSGYDEHMIERESKILESLVKDGLI